MEANQMSSRTERLMSDLPQNAIYREIVPMESAIAFPAPYRSQERLYLVFPVYRLETQKSGRCLIYAPFLTLTLDWLNGRLRDIADMRLRPEWQRVNFDRPVGAFPHPGVAQMTRQEYLSERSALLHNYDMMFDALALKGDLPPFWMRDFSKRAQTMLEPSLLPFLGLISPKFYRGLLSMGNAE